jgi:hypothetical protein
MILSRTAIIASVVSLCACATDNPREETHTLYAPGQMNLNPISDRTFTPAEAMVIGMSDKTIFRQRYHGRLMKGVMHFVSANISTERETVAFFKTYDAEFTCRVDKADIPILVKWGSQSDVLVEGYMFYGASFIAGQVDIFLTGCKISRSGW